MLNETPLVSLNAARDVGARLAAMTIWGIDGRFGVEFAASYILKESIFQREAVITQQ